MIGAIMYIRPATIEDVHSLFEIRCSVHENHMSREQMAALNITPDTVRNMIASGDYIVPVAFVDSEAVGFAMAQISESYIFALFVTPSHEGRGIGSQLLGYVEAALHRHGVREAWLCTDADEKVRAVGFYRHFGWCETGLMEDGQLRFCKQLFANS